MHESQMNATREILLWMVVYLGIIGWGTYIVRSLTPTTNDIGYVNAVILGVTGLVLIWYTVETKYLRKEAQRQIEVQQRPFVVFEVGDFGTKRDALGREVPFRFCVRNIGLSTASNVRVQNVSLLESAEAFIHFPDVVTVLPVGMQQPIHAEGSLQGKPMHDYLHASLDPRYTTRPLMVTVEFQNVEMTQYFVTQKVAPGLLEIIDAGKISNPAQGGNTK